MAQALGCKEKASISWASAKLGLPSAFPSPRHTVSCTSTAMPRCLMARSKWDCSRSVRSPVPTTTISREGWARLVYNQVCLEGGFLGLSTSALPSSNTYSGLQHPKEREAFLGDVLVGTYLCGEETS